MIHWDGEEGEVMEDDKVVVQALKHLARDVYDLKINNRFRNR